MKNRKITIVGLVLLVVVLLLTAFFVVYIGIAGKTSNEPDDSAIVGTFGEFSSYEPFQEVPTMVGRNSKVGEASDYGDKNYLVDVNGTTLEEYYAYLDVLTEAGFKKHSDNGKEGMEGYVYTTAFTKSNLTLTVAHLVKFNKTYISVSEDLELSEHMIYKEEYVQNLNPNAKTSVHMLELNSNGNSYIIQLKNGHFVVEDGGRTEDAPYFLDYIESLTPEGEKPVIEAWFISHAHNDHYGVLQEIATNPKYCERIYVEGVYFTRYNNQTAQVYAGEDGLSEAAWYITSSAKTFKTEKGERTKFYRTQLGQKYYFCDIEIDVCFTLEQLQSNSSTDFNDTSTWLMHYIEGQKFLHGGDGARYSTMTMLTLYDQEYFDVEIFSVLHHGINVYDYLTDYISYETLLYTSIRKGSMFEPTSKYAWLEENAHMQEKAKETYTRGEGTIVMEFPYAVGTAKQLEPCDWRYNYGTPVRRIYE